MTFQEMHDEYVYNTELMFLELRMDINQAFDKFNESTKKALKDYDEKIKSINNSIDKII